MLHLTVEDLGIQYIGIWFPALHHHIVIFHLSLFVVISVPEPHIPGMQPASAKRFHDERQRGEPGNAPGKSLTHEFGTNVRQQRCSVRSAKTLLPLAFTAGTRMKIPKEFSCIQRSETASKETLLVHYNAVQYSYRINGQLQNIQEYTLQLSCCVILNCITTAFTYGHSSVRFIGYSCYATLKKATIRYQCGPPSLLSFACAIQTFIYLFFHSPIHQINIHNTSTRRDFLIFHSQVRRSLNRFSFYS